MKSGVVIVRDLCSRISLQSEIPLATLQHRAPFLTEEPWSSSTEIKRKLFISLCKTCVSPCSYFQQAVQYFNGQVVF